MPDNIDEKIAELSATFSAQEQDRQNRHFYERRLVKVQVCFDVLFDLMTVGNVILGKQETIEGIPPDAKFITSTFDERTMTASLVFEHDSFNPVPRGGVVPVIDIVVRCNREQNA